MNTEKKGVTLIELLVVISIISLLSSIVLSSLNTARASSRDAIRDSDVYVIKQALERFYIDNGFYPSSAGCQRSGDGTPNTSWCSSKVDVSHWIGTSNQLEPYLPSDPKDPLMSGDFNTNLNGGAYYYFSSGGFNGSTAGQFYILTIGYENKTRTSDFRTCSGSTYTLGGDYITGNSVC